MENISVLVVVYNEEKRIERFLMSFSCFDEIIVIDKSSTDNTVVICKDKSAKVVVIPYTDQGDIGKYGLEIARNNWILFVTASDIIHPQLKTRLVELINKNNFHAELVFVPYMIYCHGINSVHSVSDSDYRPCLAKKNIVSFKDKVHEELSFNTKNRYFLPKNRKVAILHLTHQSIDSSFERAIRYTKEEAKKNYSLKAYLKIIFKVVFWGIKRRFWKIGWDGVALMFLLLNYHIMAFLRIWEKKRNIYIETYYNKLASKYEI
jgi:glycosyltransferase involved in cell wall biosynthesis